MINYRSKLNYLRMKNLGIIYYNYNISGSVGINLHSKSMEASTFSPLMSLLQSDLEIHPPLSLIFINPQMVVS